MLSRSALLTYVLKTGDWASPTVLFSAYARYMPSEFETLTTQPPATQAQPRSVRGRGTP